CPSSSYISAPPLHDALPIWYWVANPLARTASAAVAEAGRRTVRCHAEVADSAKHTHTCSVPASFAIHCLRPLGERIDEARGNARSEEHTSELQSRENLVCRL